MASGIFGIGASALSAAQAGLLTAGHNIANANTAGYSRQRIEQSAGLPHYSGSGFFGSGVQVDTVRRQYDALLGAELRAAQAQASHSQAYLDQIARIDGLLADPLSGLSPAMDSFFAGVHDVSTRPADPAARQNLLSSANALAGRFHELDGQFGALRDSINRRITDSVGEINALASQIAEMNRQVTAAYAGGAQTQPPNDLLDKRDALVDRLSQQARISVVEADDGGYDVFLGNGQVLVQRNQAYALSVRPDPLDAENVQIGLQTGAAVIAFRSSDLSGGVLGGLLAFRDNTLDAAQNALGRIALVLADAFNDQHRLGVDLNGVAGTDFFAIGGPQVLTQSAATLAVTVSDYSALSASDYRLKYDGANYTLTRLNDGNTWTFAALPQTVDGLDFDLSPPLPAPAANDTFLIQPTRSGASALRALISDPRLVAAAAPVRTSAGAANTGSATIDAGSVSAAYLAAPLGAAVTLTYDAATGNLSGLPATPAFAYTSGAPITWNGITFTITGPLGDGDSFTLAPNTNGIGDNRNALALAGLQTGALVGGASLQQSYAQLVSDVGNRTREMQAAADAQANLVVSVAEERQMISGVNLDEEAADLLRYQQAYQAAGKLMGIASTLFDTILGIGN
jgi:flagellar hook-associated protein 1 FlgK